MKTLLPACLPTGALIAASALAWGSPALAADGSHGQQLFRQQCGLCHTAGAGDGDGGSGPSLKGVVGRKVGGDASFSYSPSLSDAKETWTADGLNTFLADPNKARPGTSMPISVASDADRADVIAYLATVKGP